MFLLVILLSLAVTLSGCKSEEVQFAQAENSEFVIPTPPAGSGGEDIPEVQPPVVQITRKPESHFLGGSTRVAYKVIRGDFPVKEVNCSVDGWPLPCLLTSFLVELSGFDLGKHEVKIQAEDSQGLKGESSAIWVVSNQFQSVSENISVEPAGNQADILFVIDNSGSMAEEQAEMARKISHFFANIRRLDWKVAIITTDPYAFDPSTQFPNLFADGALLRFPNRSYWLDSSLSEADARDQFAQTIQRKEEGSGHERGIRNTYRAIQRSLNPSGSVENQRLHDFFRDQASLSVVLISDENETTLDAQGFQLPEGFMSQGLNLVNYIKGVLGTQKKFQFNSVIVRPGDMNCLGQYESYGTAYVELSNLTNGVIEDICASDYTGALRSIASGVINLQKVYSLRCSPFDENGDGRPDFKVIRQQNAGAVPTFQIKGDKVTFSQPLASGSYNFQYSCLVPVPN